MKFKEYFDKIGIKEQVYSEKLPALTNIASSLCPEEIERALSTDAVKDRGLHLNPDLWFFSNSYALYVNDWLSIENCATKLNIKILPLNIQWLDVQASHYDFKKAETNSRLDVSVKFKGYPFGQVEFIKITAAAQNCDELKEIVAHYLKPRG